MGNFKISKPLHTAQWIEAHQQPYPFQKIPVQDWNALDTNAWLESLGNRFKTVAGVFLAYRIDGFCLSHLTEADLKDILGIDNAAIRHEIIGKISTLQGEQQRQEQVIR